MNECVLEYFQIVIVTEIIHPNLIFTWAQRRHSWVPESREHSGTGGVEAPKNGEGGGDVSKISENFQKYDNQNKKNYV